MFLTRKLAGSVKYIVFGALFITVREKKNYVPKGGRFCSVCEHKDLVRINSQFPHNYHYQSETK